MQDPRKHGFTFEIGTPEAKVRTTLAIPHEPIRLSDLARAVLPLDDQLVEMSVKKHLLPVLDPNTGKKASPKISCTKGCTSCCHQLIPASLPEAFLVHDLVSGLPEDKQEALLARVVDAEEANEQGGLDVMSLAQVSSEDELRRLLLAYHRANIPCPFLENDACSIYRQRPSTCREYLVTTPAENCSKIGEVLVSRVPVSIRMTIALARVAGRLLNEDPFVLPFTFAIAYAEEHEEQREKRFDGYTMMNMLLEELSGKTAG